ncbi:MAG: cephalosporin hydroxylase family protein [Halieaceae bacterium]
MNEIEKFREERKQAIASYPGNENLVEAAARFTEASIRARYSYNFDWAGRPIIQYPQDMVALQEVIWSVQPDLIIECGVAHGGSLILSASMLAMNEYARAAALGEMLDPSEPGARVVGIDIDIRAHNRAAIEAHPLSGFIQLIEGSSVEESVVKQVHGIAANYEKVLVCLDSNHTHEHVLAELEAYAALASVGSYCIVFDTNVEDLPADLFPDRPWGVGDNPKTAVLEYLESHNIDSSSDCVFEIDEEIENKLLVTVAPQGYLRRVR